MMRSWLKAIRTAMGSGHKWLREGRGREGGGKGPFWVGGQEVLLWVERGWGCNTGSALQERSHTDG